MSIDALARRSLELLIRGHSLYTGDRVEPDVSDTPERLRGHADRLARAAAPPGFAAAQSRQMTNDLRTTATADTELTRSLNSAHANHETGRSRTRAVLDDARTDRMPAADTPIGRRDAARRMAARLRLQHSYIRRSRRDDRRLARRLRRLAYLRSAHATRKRQLRASQAVPLTALRYHRAVAPGGVRNRIAAALDHLGIKDREARLYWISGYQTLIARESGGRPSAVAAEPATAPGPAQPDGYGLGYARGLTQTIPATFARYHQPGTSANIYDPVANICASMNYVMHRYGVSRDGTDLTALVQQADPHRPPRGY